MIIADAVTAHFYNFATGKYTSILSWGWNTVRTIFMISCQ